MEFKDKKDFNDYIFKRLAHFQAMYSGKAPFGPLDDLNDLYDSMKDDQKKELLDTLNDYKSDNFWQKYIEMFYKYIMKEKK